MWSSESGGGVSFPVVLRDETGRAFVFRPVRLLRDGAESFLLAEREDAGTLHVLRREDDALGLVRDETILQRVAVRLELLRRAMEGELVEWTVGAEKHFFGVFEKGAIEGRPYVLAADLADPATVIAFEPTAQGLRPLEDRLVVLLREQLEGPARAFDLLTPNALALTLGLRGERVRLRDAAGREQTLETAGRFFFQGRDLLFLRAPEDDAQAFAVEMKDGGAIEPIRDASFLDALDQHLQTLRTGAGRA